VDEFYMGRSEVSVDEFYMGRSEMSTSVVKFSWVNFTWEEVKCEV